MRHLSVLLVAVALFALALAQNDALQQMLKNHRGRSLSPAFKPILVHTGRPITQRDKDRIHASLLNTYMKINHRPRKNPGNTPPPVVTTFTVTPSQTFQNGFVEAEAYFPAYVDASQNKLVFSCAGTGSYLQFDITANANTTYVLTFQVESIVPNPTFTIFPGILFYGPVNASEAFTGTLGSNQFAYAFVANNAGTLNVTVYCNNIQYGLWKFDSCEITATPLN